MAPQLVMALGVVSVLGCASARPAASPADFHASALEPPKQAACRVHTSPPHRSWGAPLPLAAAVGEQPFGHVFRAPAVLSVGASGVLVSANDGFFSLTAHTELERARVFPRRAEPRGAYTLLPGASGALESVQGDVAAIERRLSGPLRPASDDRVRWSFRCDELSLSRVEYDAWAALSLLPRTGYGYVSGGQRLTLLQAPRDGGHPEPEGPEGSPARGPEAHAGGSGSGGADDSPTRDEVVVHLARGEWLELSLFQQREGWVRVGYAQGGELVSGWVRREVLRFEPRSAARVSYAGGERYALPRRVDARPCAVDVAIGVWRGSRAAQVGVLRAGASLAWDRGRPLPERGLVPVQIPHASWLELFPGASLVARAAELRRCDGGTSE
ncbi:MAG: hypothetical protein KIT72_08910 [Polyangiaceae bacterium]|nr:hypothetical protein [Polyangiaceae bacterium]MCW5790529.1 hypothetical protein [Polyangiaceae bacterium]